MFAKVKLAAMVLIPLFALPACDKGHGAETSPAAATNEGSRDFVRYEPGSAPLGPPPPSVWSLVAPGGRTPASAFGAPKSGSPLPCW